MLRDRIIWGINNEPIQKELLQETDLTYANVVSIAKGFEMATKNLKEMQAPGKAKSTSGSSTGVHVKSEPVHKVAGKRASTAEGGAQVICHRCGKPGHLATVCRFRDSVCHKCKMKGRLAKVCTSKSRPQPAPQGKSTKRTTSQPVRQLDEEYDSDTDNSMQPILTIGQRRDGHTPPIKVQVEVDKVSMSMEIDTGACVSIISENRYHKLWPGRSISTSTIRLQTYSK